MWTWQFVLSAFENALVTGLSTFAGSLVITTTPTLKDFEAASIAGGHGYSSPFSGNTGPTTWMVPGFTVLLAGVFKVFGIYTPLSAFVIQAIDSLFPDESQFWAWRRHAEQLSGHSLRDARAIDTGDLTCVSSSAST